MSPPKKVIIVHGNGGCTAYDHWYQWLKRELEKAGVPVIVPTMPDNVQAKASVWLPYFKDILRCDENTIIIGHSSGAVAALRYAEENKLLGTMLIGVCHTDLGYESERISGYYDKLWQWKQIQQNQRWIILVASDDDPFIPIAEPQFIHEQLRCEYHEFTDQGHFMHKEIPVVLPLLFNKLKKPLR